MAQVLNIFKSTQANLTANLSQIYTAPTGYTTVMLSAQISNISSNNIYVSAAHVRTGNVTSIITSAGVPSNDVISLLSGKLILQTGDSFYANCIPSGDGQIILSILETANP
jgi:hypothetical protein